MERPVLIFAVLLSLLAVTLGLVVFAIFNNLMTGKLKGKYRGFWKRFFSRLRKKIVLVLILTGVICIIIVAALNYNTIAVTAKNILNSAGKTAVTETLLKPEEESLNTAESLGESAAESTEESYGKTKIKQEQAIIADHKIANMVRLDQIPDEAIQQAKDNLHIVYAHAEHGSQLTYGMRELINFKGRIFAGLNLDDYYMKDEPDYPDLSEWASRVPLYLEANKKINVVLWSWGDLLNKAETDDVNTYLDLMNRLETDFPDVHFVYMTGHLNGSGTTGKVHLLNERIREYCRENNKVLYDFADIESYDPDGNYYVDKRVNDGCWYDSDGNGSLDTNWAETWQNANPSQWYHCYSAHSYPLNANLKAYAAWWLWARLAGWKG